MATRNPAYRFASPTTFSALSLPDSPQRTAIPAVTYLVEMFAVVIQGSSIGNLIARFNQRGGDTDQASSSTSQ